MSDCEIILGKSEEVVPTIKGPIHAIITDPPYGMKHKSGSAQTASGKRFVRPIANDEDVDGAVDIFLEVMEPLVEKTADDAEMYVFTRNLLIKDWHEIVNLLKPFEVENILVWDKGSPGQGDLEGNWAFSWEPIIYAKKGRHKIPARRSSVISVDKVPNSQIIHPTQKPVQLLEILISMSTMSGNLVVDPFAGSGSTIIAAQNLGRRAIGIEMDEFYVNLARPRLNQMVFDL